MKKYLLLLTALFSLSAQAAPWTIAIDPGHGGKDPGAISRNMRMYEKNVTISIARELKSFLDKDPNFHAVMTRTGDYYISVPDRSEIARRKKANYLVSIHADSSENAAQRGASVWVLSNRRANDEMGQWLEDHEKQSELLGGAGNVLAGHSNEKYLNQTVLDLQFGHSQREGYELGDSILRNFAKITTLSRSRPQHASLGVLRSPDIPSVLVETGFLSNAEEEAKLSSQSYRRRIAYIIYQGIVDYRKRNGGLDVNTTVKAPEVKEYVQSVAKTETKTENKADSKTDNKAEEAKLKDSGVKHTVKSGDRLDKIAKQYNVKADDIVALNKLKRKELIIGQTLHIPDNGKSAVKNDDKSDDSAKATVKDSGVKHTVKSGDRLDKIAKQYNVKADDIVALNKLKRKELVIGQTLRIPDNGKSAVKNDDKSDDSAKATVKDSGVKHTVKSGDRLDKIAKQYNVKADDIVVLNKLKRKELVIGQTLRIPDNGKSAVKNDDKSDNSAKATVKDSSVTHTVKSGEHLDKIAKKYGVSEKDIVTLNGLKRKELRIGEKIKIPAKAKAEKVQEALSEKDKKAEKGKKAEAKDTKNSKDKKTEKNQETPKYHVIEKNQTIYAVARLYGVPANQLLKLNPKLKNGKVVVGQKIQVKE